MNNPKLKTVYWLSYLIAFLAIFASIGGLLFRSVYRDNAFVKTTWLGNDAVTLFLAVPILIAALVFSRRGSLKAYLVWMGMLDYMLYNYAFYLFGTAFNAFFLIYIALLVLSIFGLIYGLAYLNRNKISQSVQPRLPVRWIGGYFLFVALGLSVIYISQSIAFIITGQVPAIVTTSGSQTNLVFALDLTLMVPWLTIGAIWLIKREPWGYVIAGMLNVKAPLYTFILAVNSLLVMQSGLPGGAELPLWIALTVLGSIASGLFYWNMHPVISESHNRAGEEG